MLLAGERTTLPCIQLRLSLLTHILMKCTAGQHLMLLYADASFHKTTSPPAFYEWANYPLHLREHIIYNLQIDSLKRGFPNGSSWTLRVFEGTAEILIEMSMLHSIRYKKQKKRIKHNDRNISQVDIHLLNYERLTNSSKQFRLQWFSWEKTNKQKKTWLWKKIAAKMD